MDEDSFMLPENDDEASIFVSQGKKRKKERQVLVKSENFSYSPSKTDPTVISILRMSPKYQNKSTTDESNKSRKKPFKFVFQGKERDMEGVEGNSMRHEFRQLSTILPVFDQNTKKPKIYKSAL